MVWSFSDPSVSLEYVTDLLKASRATSRYTALVTPGYATIAALDLFGRYLDGLSLELRAFDDGAYRRLTGVNDWRGVLEFAAHARNAWNCHIEVTTHTRMSSSPRADPGRRRLAARFCAWRTHALAHPAGRCGRSCGCVGGARAPAGPRNPGLLYVYGPEPDQHTRCHQCHAVSSSATARAGAWLALTTACAASAAPTRTCGSQISSASTNGRRWSQR